MGDDRPFVCTAPGCGQRFTNEDHLSVHKHKHEMTLKFGPARTDSVIIADQTPTPTRFLKNCEEVGLFNDLANSFEQDFCKVQEEDHRTKNTASTLQTQYATSQTKCTAKNEDDDPLEVDSSPPDSPDSSSSMSDISKDSREILTKPVASSAQTPTIAPPSNRQLSSPTSSYPLVRHLANGQTVPLLPSPVQMTSVISLVRPGNSVPNIPGIPGPPVGGASSGSSSPSGYHLQSETKMRLKAALSNQGPGGHDGGGGGGAGSFPAVPQKQQQSQQPTQNSDAPSPAQPQVSPAQPTGGRRRRASEMDPDERRQRFLERNRAAASRCRQKRKLWVNSLEKKADDLASMNVSLTNEVTLLRNEVAQLKHLLLAHKDCPVTVMQKKAAFLAAGGEEASREISAEPIGSPAAVIQHGPSPSAPPSSPGPTINGMSVRAAEAVAMSVLAGMGSGQPGGVVMLTQSQSTSR
ncbi:cyclic AMP-dependent transcription factor ATF-7b isoform X2 [Phyllopteryx taeniolatus]|uniref:cyclic AMP-dependent transcription factor ATF-7b isoform X2 n=1 Tax=Phyllopteryx taeniolatus TaxID=161469 RepID=UPI002AD290C0|nr:cyclic AMP-dependent transcription factor ATF-7b isoform X2 [Phyllopteryx taeniolatus]